MKRRKQKKIKPANLITGVLLLAFVAAVAATNSFHPIASAEADDAAAVANITTMTQEDGVEWDYACMSAQTTGNKLRATLDELVPKVLAAIRSAKLEPASMFITTFHGATLDANRPYTVDLGVRVASGVASMEGLQIVHIPRSRHAMVILTGNLSHIPDAYVRLFTQVVQAHLHPADVNRQILLHWEGADSDKNVVEVQVDLFDDATSKPVVAQQPSGSPSNPGPERTTDSTSAVDHGSQSASAGATPTAAPPEIVFTPVPHQHAATALANNQATASTPPKIVFTSVPHPRPATAPVAIDRATTSTPPDIVFTPVPHSSAPSLAEAPPPVIGFGSTNSSSDSTDLHSFTLVVNRRSFFDNLRGALTILAHESADRTALTFEIQGAREAYWRAYPNGPNLNQLADAYGDALNRKASFYLDQNVRSLTMSAVGGDASGATALSRQIEHATGSVDNGYDDWVRSEFRDWVERVGLIPNPNEDKTGVASAKLERAMPEFLKFSQAEDMDEFLTNSPTSPERSSDPKTFFLASAVRTGNCLTFAEARTLYNDLIPIVGEPVILDAIQHVQKLSVEKLPLALALNAAAGRSADDRVLLLAILQVGETDPLGSLNAAQVERDSLFKRLGESRVLAAAAALRSPAFNEQLAARQFYRSLSIAPPAWVNTRAIYTLFSFASLDSAPWNCLARGSTGNSLVGLRSNYAGDMPFVHRAQYDATHPLIPREKPSFIHAPPSPITAPTAQLLRSVTGKQSAMDIVRVDCNTRALTVLAGFDSRTLAEVGVKPVMPQPGSLIADDGWVYGTDAASGGAFRVREDGTGFMRLPIPQKTGERPMFFGVNRKHNILGGTIHSIFAMSPDGSKIKMLVSDPVNWIIPGDIAPDGTIYFQIRRAVPPSQQSGPFDDLDRYFDPFASPCRIDPTSRRVIEISSTLRINQNCMSPIGVAHDGRAIGPYFSGFFEFEPQKGFTVHPGDLELRDPFSRPVECNGRVYCISYPVPFYANGPDVYANLIGGDLGGTPRWHLGAFGYIGGQPCAGLIRFDSKTLVGALATGNDGDGGCIYAIDATDPNF